MPVDDVGASGGGTWTNGESEIRLARVRLSLNVSQYKISYLFSNFLSYNYFNKRIGIIE